MKKTRIEMDEEYQSYRDGYTKGSQSHPLTHSVVDEQEFDRGFKDGQDDFNERMKVAWNRISYVQPEIGTIMKVKMFYSGTEYEMPIHAIKEHKDKRYYLVYWRESDGPIACWKTEEEVSLVEGKPEYYDGKKKLTQEELIESINYGNPLFFEEGKGIGDFLKDQENSWNMFVEHFKGEN